MRTYRFPPLEVLQAPCVAVNAGASTDTSASAADAQNMALAYEQAVQRGHDQGFEQGQQEGLQAGLQAARAQGLEEGRAQAMQGMRAALAEMGQPIDQMLQQLQGLHADWQASLRKDVIDLVERVARQVVRCELTLQPAQILALVEETLQGMPHRTGDVVVYLNPADLQRIQELDATRIPAWTLQADASMEAGECRLRVGEEEADAGCKQRLQACMEQVREQLLEPAEPEQPAES